MADYDKIVRDRQRLIRRQIDARRIAIKAVQLDGGWSSPSTVLSYFPADADREPAIMSAASLFRLLETGALPADLLSLMLPDGFQIVKVPEGVDLDDQESEYRGWLAMKGKAHHPLSENGRDIGPNEDAALRAALPSLRVAA